MTTVGQFSKDYGELISITLIPFILWYVGIKFQDRQAKNKAKEDLFLALMAKRKSNPISIEWADSLNKIDVVFQDNSKVRTAWRAYHDSLHPQSQHFENSNSFLLDLMSEIAKDLGYKDLKQTDIDRFYNPAYFGNQSKNQQYLFDEMMRIYERSKNLAEPFSDEEYKQYQDYLKSKRGES
jgi:hypothetical protein